MKTLLYESNFIVLRINYILCYRKDCGEVDHLAKDVYNLLKEDGHVTPLRDLNTSNAYTSRYLMLHSVLVYLLFQD